MNKQYCLLSTLVKVTTALFCHVFKITPICQSTSIITRKFNNNKKSPSPGRKAFFYAPLSTSLRLKPLKKERSMAVTQVGTEFDRAVIALAISQSHCSCTCTKWFFFFTSFSKLFTNTVELLLRAQHCSLYRLPN